MSSGIANASPSESQGSSQVGGLERFGSDSDGSESAAEAFTQFLEEEAKGDKPAPRAPKGERREAPAPKDGADDGEGQPPKRQPAQRERQEAPDDDNDPLRDPILDPPSKPKGNDEDEDEGEDEPDEGEDAEDDEGEGDDEDDDPEHEVTVRGVPTKVKLSELIQGYHREADYRQKTTALAEDRQIVHQRFEHANQRVTMLDGAIQTYQDLINAVMPSQQDWEALEAANPAEYIKAQKQWGEFLGKMEQSKAHRDQLVQQREQAAAEERNEYIRQENQKLLERVPALADKAVGKQFSDIIFGYGKKMGYTAEELQAGLVNHRDVLTAYYAGKYLELQESRAANRKGTKAGKPRASEGTTQNVRTPQTPKGRRFAENRRSLRAADRDLQRSGSQDSAAKAFTALFRD